MASFRILIEAFVSKPKRLFLLDGVGALVTAALLLGLLAPMEDLFGMPRWNLYPLSGIAMVFAAYSLACHFLLRRRWRPFLRAIAYANLAYCCLTLVSMIYLSQSLTALGIAYFAGEIIVVLGLVGLELAVGRKLER